MRACALLLTLALSLVGAEGPTDEQIAAELELLQGTWKLEAVELDGRKLDIAAFKDIVRIVDGYEITWKNKEEVIARTTITFDPTKSPKTMESTFTEGDNQGKTMLAIYEIKGDEFRICAAEFDRVRPTEFASPPGSGVLIFKAKRVKPD